MKDRVSIGAAAARMGVSVDAMRGFEEAGLITAERTPGGHRRFRLADVLRLKGNRPGTGATHQSPSRAPLKRRKPAAVRHRSPEPDDGMLDELEVADMQAPEPRSTVEPKTKPAMTAWAAQANSWAADLAKANERTSIEVHLRSLRHHGEARMPYNASASARSAVIEALDGYVSLSRFPRSMPFWDAHRAIDAKVDAILEPFVKLAAQEAAAKQELARQEQRGKALIERGKSRVLVATLSWDEEDQREARAEVLEALEEEVEADWSDRDVDEFVDEILDDWTEDLDE